MEQATARPHTYRLRQSDEERRIMRDVAAAWRLPVADVTRLLYLAEWERLKATGKIKEHGDD